MTDDSGRMTDVRRQKTDDRDQMTEIRGRMTDARCQKTDDRGQNTGKHSGVQRFKQPKGFRVRPKLWDEIEKRL